MLHEICVALRIHLLGEVTGKGVAGRAADEHHLPLGAQEKADLFACTDLRNVFLFSLCLQSALWCCMNVQLFVTKQRLFSFARFAWAVVLKCSVRA